MPTPKCLRCGDRFERMIVSQVHCPRCTAEVAAIVAADTARRTPRFPVAKSLDGWRPAA